jgi:deoxycytidine triphosphate deaminase
MELLSGKHAATRVAGILNSKYQVHGYSVHLTVRNIFSLDPVGQLDFGGHEYLPAGRLAIATSRRRPEDRYEWWDLGRGCYFVEFNETLELAEDEIALLEPHERLLRTGATHVPMFLRGRVAPIEALLQVETLRLELKQNARISRVRVFRLLPPAEAVSAPVARATKAPRKTARARKPRRKK